MLFQGWREHTDIIKDPDYCFGPYSSLIWQAIKNIPLIGCFISVPWANLLCPLLIEKGKMEVFKGSLLEKVTISFSLSVSLIQAFRRSNEALKLVQSSHTHETAHDLQIQPWLFITRSWERVKIFGPFTVSMDIMTAPWKWSPPGGWLRYKSQVPHLPC